MEEVVGIILFNEEGKILLQHRDGNPKNYPNKWALFGGHKEPGEEPRVAIIRECEEELEYQLENPIKIYEGNFLERFTLHLYAEQYNKQKILTQKEGDAMGWFTIAEIPQLDSQFKTLEIFKPIQEHLDKTLRR